MQKTLKQILLILLPVVFAPSYGSEVGGTILTPKPSVELLINTNSIPASQNTLAATHAELAKHKITMYRVYQKHLKNNATLKGGITFSFIVTSTGKFERCFASTNNTGAESLVVDICEIISHTTISKNISVGNEIVMFPIDFMNEFKN